MTVSDAWQDLDEHLIGDEDELHDDRPMDLERAERLLRARARRIREMEQWEMVAQAERDRLEAWLADHRKRLSTEWIDQQLEAFHRARLADDPRAKSISLPSGTLVARQGQPAWDINPDVFLPWAQSHAPDLVRVKHEVDRAAVKKALLVEGGNAISADGEVVPGVQVADAEVRFSIKGDES